MTREEQWQKFADQIGGEDGQRLAEAYREFYATFDDSLIDWVANLFDPTIGGYYYSNGARDNEGFLPDIESTHQALEMFRDLGLADDFGRSYAKALPAWMGERIVKFVKDMQRPNGYFYHPQWTIENTDSKPHRRGRDLMWANSILRNYGVLPTYDCPDGVKGERPMERPDVPASENGTNSPKSTYAPHLQDGKVFKAYLEKMDFAKNSYGCGNMLAAQANQIAKRNEELGGEIFKVMFDFLDSHQNTEMGHWDFRKPGTEEFIPYHGQNGLFKISFLYNMAKRPIPNIEKSIQVALDGIYSDAPVGIVCDVYNSWYTLSSLMGNIRATNSKEEGERKIAEIRSILYKDAVKVILKTRDKIKDFRKPDGGFSYLKNRSSELSQSMPVTLPNMPESDVNATIISGPQLINFSMDVLGIKEYRVPIFTRKEYEKYIDILEKNKAAAESKI
ncbi:MAG: hypothetical protein IJX92_02540 [Clostridia bacterium]|nr:hypothetical protein [Clostridia bacterium]